MIYMRWRDGESRRGRVYSPLPEDAPMRYFGCVLCDMPLGARMIQLVAVGPYPGHEAAVERHRAGLWYAATAAIGHSQCVAAASDEHLEAMCTGELTLGLVGPAPLRN